MSDNKHIIQTCSAKIYYAGEYKRTADFIFCAKPESAFHYNSIEDAYAAKDRIHRITAIELKVVKRA